MALCKIQLIDDDFDNDDEQFRGVVFEFIERIGREVSLYDDYEPNINAINFKHIEMQIQAQRIQKVLDLCIDKIKRVFYLFDLIEHYNDEVKLLFSKEDAEKIEYFSRKWFEGTIDSSNTGFNSDLYQCIEILEKVDIDKQQVN